ncbi:hypothetical protein ACI00O_003600 [Cronobacter sakazakii]|nr:hypothetical protein [Cronobacter sakazakii]ELY4533176.1 hypothetical protein [Cronobacter sakazakii]
MINIESIISDLTSGSEGVTEALLKTKVLLFSLKSKEPVAWVNHELTGYPKDAELPSYRVVRTRVLIDANNFTRSYKGLELPLSHFNDEQYDKATLSRIDFSISQIEKILREAGDAPTIQQPIPIEFARYYAPRVDNSYEITCLYRDIPIHCLTSIITQVRSKLLDFLLELSYKLDEIHGDSMVDKAKKVDAAAIFSNAIFGPNTTINFGNDNNITINNIINKFDFEALKNELRSNSISDEDIEELRISLVEDDRIGNKPEKSYGPHVSSWFAKMISKAADSTWNISVSAATTVLTTALNQYFGFNR